MNRVLSSLCLAAVSLNAQVFQTAIAPGKASPIAVTVLPDAACKLSGHGDSGISHSLTLYSDDQGHIRFHAQTTAESIAPANLSLQCQAGSQIKAAVLSGTGGKPSLIAAAGRLVARIERRRHGAKGKSALLGALSFDEFNKAFRPNRTAFDWLSRDEAEVDRYVADPLCGFGVSTQLWVDMLDTLAFIARPEEQARVPRDLPVYVFCGSEDPVGERTRSVRQLLDAYARAGIEDVQHKFYPGARHETLNETNRDEVTRDLIAWLDANVR